MLEVFLLSLIVGFTTWFFIQRRRRFSFFKDLGIPGPPPSFLSGNLSELIQKGTLDRYKEWLDKYGDIVGFYNGAHPFLIVKDPELIKKIQIKDFHNFHSRGEKCTVISPIDNEAMNVKAYEYFQVSSSFASTHPIYKKSTFNAQGERWKKMRGLLTPAFTTSNMKKRNRCDFLQLMLNAEVEDANLVNVHSLTASGDADSASEGNQPEKVKAGGKTCVLTNTEILANGFSFFTAGFETTGSSMAFLSYLLAKHQDIQDRLREDALAVLKRDGAFTYDNVFGIKYLDQIISESLRFYSPVVGFTTRRCAREYVHKDMKIPAGTSIVIPNHHLSHDPNFWEKPEVFDPERFSPQNKGLVDPVVYQPFGQGPRNCVGMRFAQLEMKLTMAKLLAKYKLLLDERHIKEKNLELESTFIFAMPKDGIWLKIEKVI
nr:cytochrome P450 3A4-like [Rhipicephalus microplus]